MEFFEQYESNVRIYCRNFPVIFERAKGSFMYDEHGREYIDFFSGAGALCFGHNHPYIKKAVMEFLQGNMIAHALDMYTVVKRDFMVKFRNEIVVRRGFDYKLQFIAPTGTNGVEAALKLARKVKKRSNIFALTSGFHGMSLGSLAATSNRMARAGAGAALNNVVIMPSPGMFPQIDTIDYMDTLLGNDHSGVDIPAAIIVESIQAEGGVYLLDDEYLRRLRKLCDKYDMLLIVDDIQVGGGRCGGYFSFEAAGIEPDMVVMAKHLSGYGFPMALLLLKPELDIWRPGEHNGTFRGNQIAFAAASAAIDLFYDCETEKEVKRKSGIISEFLNENIACESVAVRGRGMIHGIEFLNGQDVENIQRKCFNGRLIIERAGVDGKVLKLLPPLNIDDSTLIRGLEVIKKAIW